MRLLTPEGSYFADDQERRIEIWVPARHKDTWLNLRPVAAAQGPGGAVPVRSGWYVPAGPEVADAVVAEELAAARWFPRGGGAAGGHVDPEPGTGNVVAGGRELGPG